MKSAHADRFASCWRSVFWSAVQTRTDPIRFVFARLPFALVHNSPVWCRSEWIGVSQDRQGETMQVDVGVLLLRQRLTIEEAAQLIAAGSGCKRTECEDLLIEAIEAKALVPVGFARVEVIDYFDGNYLGRIDTMATTVQRADLDDWCEKKGLALPGRNIGQAGDEATDPASAAAMENIAKTALPTVHKSTTRKPDHPLKAVFEMAREKASDRDNYVCVWSALVQLATSPERPAPLVGYAEGEVKYSVETEGDTVTVCYSKGAFRQWMKREAQRQQANATPASGR
ncbi:hypothetical protein P0D88_26545 [Paraburkholderia sp. RL18-103-BIB-C]|uniref:hypothetical protein n=1 Tax=Paraburkholderia sp. RL18-103-BIB-C TaxID=3031637 RepID=UPI0038BE061E